MNAIAPQTALEGLLAVQMTAAHSLAVQLVGRASWNEDSDLRVKYAALATKLMKTFAAQIEALQRLRVIATSRSSEWNTSTLGRGGQAIVGTVRRGGGG